MAAGRSGEDTHSYQTVESCDCAGDRRLLNLDQISLMLFCADCNGLAIGTVAELDELIETLTNLRKLRFLANAGGSSTPPVNRIWLPKPSPAKH
jgi:hypothetical protein